MYQIFTVPIYKAEFNKVWNCQQGQFYPEIFTNEFYKELQGKGQRATSASFWD
jgi:CRISPR-associated endonuclease Csn1